MTELQFSKAKWMHDSEGLWLTLKVEAPFHQPVKRFCGEIKERLYAAVLKEYHPKRSLDANAYAWVLIGKLALTLRITPNEVYREAIRSIGDNYVTLPIRNDAVERWKAIWESKGIGWISEELGPSKLDGYTNMVNFYGSSVYDTRQMSALIDCIITECKAQGIETAKPDEIERLKQEWGRGQCESPNAPNPVI